MLQLKVTKQFFSVVLLIVSSKTCITFEPMILTLLAPFKFEKFWSVVILPYQTSESVDETFKCDIPKTFSAIFLLSNALS